VEFKTASELFTSWQTSVKDSTVSLIVVAAWCFWRDIASKCNHNCEYECTRNLVH